MRFQKEVNIFAPDAILKRFQANETNFSVVKGKIEALISESEIIELQNSKVTMYSKLADVKLTVHGLEQTYTDISSKYDSVTGKYTDLDAKVAEYKSTVDGFSSNLSQVKSNLKDNYSTTTTMNTAIQGKIDELSLSVSNTYATRDAVGALETWKSEASQKITDSAIVSTVTSSTEWTKKADKASLISQINQSAEQIKIRASIIDLQGNISITDISNDAMDIIKNYSITALSDAKKYTDDCDVLVLKDSQDYTRTYTLAEIGKLEASGGNLVKGYRLSADNVKTYWNTVGTVKTGQNDPDGGKNAVVITADADNCILGAKRDTNAVLNATGRYTITFWAKASKAQSIAFSFNKVRESIALTTSWKKFSFVKDVTSVEESGSLIMFGGGNTISTGDGNIYIYRPDVRHGYTSEDVFNLLTNNGKIEGMYMTGGKLYWNGAYIKSKSITTAALAADSVTAEKIKVDDLYSLKASIAGFKISSDTISHQSTTKPESGIGQTYYDTYFSSKNKRLTFRKGPGTSDYMTFGINGLRTSVWKCLDLISDAAVVDDSTDFHDGAHHSLGCTNIYGDLYVAESFRTAGTKQAVRQTENYGESLISNNNSYVGQTPAYIVIHNTDNYAKGANAKAHAKAQHDGNFKGYSAHVYVDDTEAYQALPYNRGAWHVGVNYGGRLFGTVNNRNSVGIEMCVQAGYNYEKAFQNTVQVCKQLMKQLGIPADRVVQHYDVCAKNCPSAIRAKGDWNRFKQLIGAETATPTVDRYYRTRKSWADSKSQIGAYKSLENAKKEWKQGYTIYDWNGKAVYPVQTSGKAVVLTGKFEAQLPIIRKGNSGVAVSVLQSVLGVTVDGRFGDDTETSLKVFQKNTGVKANGTCGIDSWKKVIEHVKANTK